MKIRILPFFLSIVCFACGNLSYAEAPAAPKEIGQVIWVKGTLQAQLPTAEPRALRRYSEIYEHDTVTTSPGSEGKISFKNNSVLTLQGNSTIKIDQYWHPGQAQVETFMQHLLRSIRDGFRAITSMFIKNEPGGYKVESNQSVM